MLGELLIISKVVLADLDVLPSFCRFGRVPGNVIIASNSLPNSKRLIILNGLENVSWVQSSYSAKVDSNHLLSPRYELITIRVLHMVDMV